MFTAVIYSFVQQEDPNYENKAAAIVSLYVYKIINELIDKNLIESLSRLDAPGRPMLYTTTEKFLRVFGMSSLDELPELFNILIGTD